MRSLYGPTAGTCRMLSEAGTGSPNASRSKGFEWKILIEERKRAAGIEPASSAWKAEVLPLNYARKSMWMPHKLAVRFSHRLGPPCLGAPSSDGSAKHDGDVKHYGLRM